MPIFKCNKCNKEFNRKSNFEYHINELKRPCTSENIRIIKEIVNPEPERANIEPKRADIEPERANIEPDKIEDKERNLKNYTETVELLDEKTEILNKEIELLNEPTRVAKSSIGIIKTPVVIVNEPITAVNTTNIEPDNNKTEYSNIFELILNSGHNSKNTENYKNVCIFCNSTFSYKSSLNKHLKDRCKSKKYYDELEILKDKLKQIASENEQLKSKMTELEHTNVVNNNNKTKNILNKSDQINNGVINNTNNTNNNNVTVQLVQFGKENIDDIDSQEALDVYMRSTGGNIIPNVLSLINLNSKHPENHNICMTDLSRELVKIFNGSKFVVKKFKNVKDDIMGKVINNTYKIVNKIENDKNIKKTPHIRSKFRINKVSVNLIEGISSEDIVREEIREKENLLTNGAKVLVIEDVKTKKTNVNSDSENDEKKERDFSLEEQIRIENLEEKRKGLQEISLEKLKDELYNGKYLFTSE